MFAVNKASRLVLGLVALGAMLALSTPVRADAAPTTPTITGKVVDASGVGVANVSVKLFTAPAAGAHPKKKGAAAAAVTPGLDNLTPVLLAKGAGKGKHPALQEATTAADGSFSLANLTPGDYLLVAVVKGQGSGHMKVTVKATDNTPVTLTLTPHKAGKKAKKAA